jgi:hypothetical protein
MTLLTTNPNMMSPTIIHAIAENTWGRSGSIDASLCLILALVVDVFDVEGMDMAGEETEDCEADVDEEVGAAAGNEEDADGREEEGYDYEEDCGDHFVDFAMGVLIGGRDEAVCRWCVVRVDR